MPARIYGNYSEVLGERLHLVLKIADVLTVSVQQDQWLSVALFDKVMRYVHLFYCWKEYVFNKIYPVEDVWFEIG